MKKYMTMGLLFAGLALSMNISANAAISNKTMKADIQSGINGPGFNKNRQCG